MPASAHEPFDAPAARNRGTLLGCWLVLLLVGVSSLGCSPPPAGSESPGTFTPSFGEGGVAGAFSRGIDGTAPLLPGRRLSGPDSAVALSRRDAFRDGSGPAGDRAMKPGQERPSGAEASNAGSLPAVHAILLADCTDLDLDGYGNPAGAGCRFPALDCDDTDPLINPGSKEGPPGAPVCKDGMDNDCDGLIDYDDSSCSLSGPMVDIPPGCFDMGDFFAEGEPTELPVHEVCVSAFRMDVHEVTNAEYAVCVGQGACSPPSDSSSCLRSSYYGNRDYRGFPVIYVNWFQARQYCIWAGKRLPTEAEWEFAARGGLSHKRYPGGDAIYEWQANYWNSGDPWDNDTSVAAYYEPNGFGLYDMAGNVYEWVNDWFSSGYYQECVQQGIRDDPPGPESGTYRGLRGGAWSSSTSHLRTACRDSFDPLNDYYSVGFRCAR